MIRFSAALVAVAIGVLIGGIATSKLLLVYIAIVVSAVALVALAVGVVLRREELFGESQGLVPVGAGAGPVPSRVGVSQGDGVAANTVPVGAVPPGTVPPSTGPAGAHVVPPPPYAGAASAHGPRPGGTGFGGTAQPASSAAVPSAPVVAATSSHGRSADPAPPWETPAARGQWQSPAADWMSAGQGERAAGWGSPPAKAGPGSGSPDASSGSGAPSWFERLGRQPAAEAPAARTASAPGSTRSPEPGSGWPWSAREGSAPARRDEPEGKPGPSAEASAADTVPVGARFADAAALDTGSGDTRSGEEDDWPTRYSWLEDDADDSGDVDGEAAKTVAVNVANMELRRTPPPPPAPVPSDTALSDTANPSGSTSGAAGTPDAAGTRDAARDPADETEESNASVIAFRRPRGSVGRTAVDHDEDGEDDSLAAQPGTGGEADALGEQTNALGEQTDTLDEAEDEPWATSESPAIPETTPVPEATLVTVVPGVPRYHKPDCVLIRFMPEGDVRQLPAEEAKEAGCTPCAACQPAR